MNEASNTCTFCSDVSPEAKSTFASFDILVDVTDHTGTLRSCYLSDTVAEETLGCTVRGAWAAPAELSCGAWWELQISENALCVRVTKRAWRDGHTELFDKEGSRCQQELCSE